MMMLRLFFFTAVLIVVSNTKMNGQNQWTWTFGYHNHLGIASMELDSAKGSNWGGGQGIHRTRVISLGLRYGFRFGIEANAGGHFETVSFSSKNQSAGIITYNRILGCTAYGLMPISDRHPIYMRLTLEYGRLFQDNDVVTNPDDEEDRYRYDTFKHQRNYWTPNVGLTYWKYRSMFSCGLGYQFTTNTNYFARVVIQQADGGYAIYKGTGNSLTLSFSYVHTIGTIKKKQKAKPVEPVDYEVLSKREARMLPTLHSKKRKIQLEIWDNGDLDRDSVSVQLNGELILANYELTKRKQRIRLTLNEGENRLIFMAHNEGQYPPNTAHCRIKFGRQRKIITVASDLDNNAGVLIVVD
ncbi:MAG: hypothetical protein RLZZ262_2205 [Bacteroidota bacterium]|jgi:hypothetical protein